MRLSVTMLDSYRYYRDNEDASLDDLLATLRRETVPTLAMKAGSALHKALETCNADTETLAADGFTFRFAEDCPLPLPAIRELKGEMEMQTKAGPVTLVGVVDTIGVETTDHKLTARWDAEKYIDSYQWRCYLLMFGGARFTYNVFVGKEVEPGEWLITEFHRLPVYAYVGMRADVEREVGELAAFAAKHIDRNPLLEKLVASVNANGAGAQP